MYSTLQSSIINTVLLSLLVLKYSLLYSVAIDGANESALAVLKYAESQLKADGVIPKRVTFKMHTKYMQCDKYNGSLAFIQLAEHLPIDALIGPPCSASGDVIGRLAVSYNILAISHNTDSEIFRDKQLYRTYARTSVSSVFMIADAVYKFLIINNWHQVGLVCKRGYYSDMLVEGVRHKFTEGNHNHKEDVKINIAVDLELDHAYGNVDYVLDKLYNNARIIIPILGWKMDGTQEFMRHAHRANMTGPDFLWIFMELEQVELHHHPWEDTQGNDLPSTPEVRKTYHTSIVFYIQGHDTENYRRKLIEGTESQYKNIFPNRNVTDYQWKPSHSQLYDAMYAFGSVLNKSVDAGVLYNDGHRLFDLMRWMSIEKDGFSPIRFDGDVERAHEYHIESFNAHGNWTTLFRVVRVKRENSDSVHFHYEFIKKEQIYWEAEDHSPPLDVPLFGFDGKLTNAARRGCIHDDEVGHTNCTKGGKNDCIQAGEDYCSAYVNGLRVCCIIPGKFKNNPVGLTTIIIIVVALALFIAIVFTVMFLVYRRKMEGELSQMIWLVDETQITVLQNTDSKVHRSVFSGSQNVCPSNQSLRSAVTRDGLIEKNTTLGSYEGSAVIITHHKKIKNIILTREQLVTLRNLKHIHHENLAMFIGMAPNGKDNITILWHFHASRTLRDLLLSQEITLDEDFLSSFLLGVTKGMHHLHHSDIQYHGWLTIDRCLVDKRFVVKITDYGMQSVLSPAIADASIVVEYKSYDLYHLAPEELEDKIHGRKGGSKAGDVYSLAMVFYQIVTKQELYHDVIDFTGNDEIIRLLRNYSTAPLRPTIFDDIPLHWDSVVRLIRQCWDALPMERPNIDDIHSKIMGITGKYSKNIVENLISRMEKYSTNLEKIVAERTNEVRSQEQKAQRLLEQMLPKSVAERLQAGLEIEPESYSKASILFTDIVQFTKLSSEHSALEIINLLNELYSAFDELIDQHDVYKVETIGDAYMVVSGVPHRIPNHAEQIMLLAIAMRNFVRGYKLPFDDVKRKMVQIRLGSHSGPVVSGVVGHKMPRFCLFGDSVNTASRMESTGIAMKVQASIEMRDELMNSYFKIVPRGEIEVKGKGIQKTYFIDEYPADEFNKNVVIGANID